MGYITQRKECLMFIQPKRLTLIRHGESEGNVITKMRESGKKISEDIYLNKGTHLFNLTEKGVEQALSTRKYIENKGICFNAFFVSQYLRAQKTFEIIFPNRKPDEIRSDLNEYDRGYEWLYPENLGEMYPSEAEAKRLKGKKHYRPLGGESMVDLDLRIRSFLMWISIYHSDQDIVAVGHGTWIKSLWVILTGLPRPEWNIPNASFITFERSENGKKLEFQSLVDPYNEKL